MRCGLEAIEEASYSSSRVPAGGHVQNTLLAIGFTVLQ